LSPSKNDIDPRVLGQLFAAQSAFSVFSARQKKGEFVCRAVEGVPGVASCAACLPGAERPRLGGEPVPECADCDAPEGDIDHDPSHPCRLSSRAGIRIFPLKTQDRHFGFILLKLEERERYAPYEPFVSNLANGLAVDIERRWQKDRLETASVELRRHRDHLDELVRERTSELEEDIIVRKRAEEALAESEKKHRALFETMSEGIVYEDHDGKIISANPAAERLLGLSLDQMQGRTSLDPSWKAIHVDGSPFPGETHSLNIAAKTGKPATGEVMGIYNPKSGAYVWLSINSTPEFLPGEKKPFRAYAVFNDITERKQAEEALRQGAANLDAIFESSPVGMLILDETTNIVMANAAILVLCGGSKSDVLQHRPGNALRCVHSTKDPRGCGYAPQCPLCPARNGIEALLASGGAMHGAQLPLELNRNGEPRTVWVEIGAEPIMMNGRRHLCVAMEDITENKRAEEALHENELKYRTLFETVDDANLLFTDGRWVDCNAGALRIFGCTREQIIGAHPIRFSPPMQPDGRSSEEEAIKKINLAFASGPQFFEWEHCRADGAPFAAEVFLNRLDLGGKPYMQAIVRDISERKRAEKTQGLNFRRIQTLLQLNQMIDATLQEITDFALEEVVRLTQSTMGYLAFLNEDESVLTMHSWSKSAMAECAIQDKPILYPVESTGLWGEAVRQRRPVFTNDYATANPLKKGYPQGHVAVKRHMNVPVFDGSRIVVVAGVGNKNEEYDKGDADQLILLMESMWRMIERKRSEEALQESETRLSTIIKNDPTGFFIVNEKTRIIYDVNDSALEAIGLPRGDVVGKVCHRFLCPAEMGSCPICDLGQVVDRSERVLIKPGGARVPILKTVVPIKLKGENYLLESFIDITERKQAEEELRQKGEELRARNDELEQFNRAAVGRELRMIELKQEINELCRRLGEPPRHATDQLQTDSVPGAGPAPKPPGGGGA
jgi:PAS domain S-box-containing protein